jgi:tRNA threonylcarbamoyladenosine biosynthesis protein TsaE
VSTEPLTMLSHSLEETQRLGVALGGLLRGQELICLEGELGSGKTSLIQAVGRALGVKEPITSPTFTLVNEYRGTALTIYHIDLYRLHSTEEIVQAGIENYFYRDSVCLVEWAEKALELLPPEYLYITLLHAGQDKRSISIQAEGNTYRPLLEELRLALGVRQ